MPPPRHGATAGFTLLELLVVLVIIGLVTAVVSLALGDREQVHLEEEALRLAAHLEAARAQSRATGKPVTWHSTEDGYEFIGLSPQPDADWPARQRWGLNDTQAWISQPPQATLLLLGPEPLLPPQTLTLQHGPHSVQLGSDGLRPFSLMPSHQPGGPQP